jgi:SAM-dependent MidA family methyltransferase
MSFEAGYRRDPSLSRPEPGSDPVLVERIAAEIAVSGPITFARFMQLALYEPNHGYYRSGTARPGRGGDFLTAPEVHPIFGAALARQVLEIRRLLGSPDPFVVREHGAGTGALAASLLEAVARDAADALPAIRYEAVEVDSRRVDALRATLARVGLDDRLTPASDDRFDGVILANELLDALPVHRVVARGGLRELRVAWADGAFHEVETDPSTPALAQRLREEAIVLAEGQVAEICLDVDGWMAGAADSLARGVLLVIDYGAPAAELYDPARRPRGTLMAYVGHLAHDDPYRNVGRQDLTAHVDVTAVERAAARAGLDLLGSTSQAEFLVGLGLEEMLRAVQADPATTLSSYVALRSAVMRLLDPAASGGFRVLAFGRGLPAGATLPAFSFRVRG